MVEHKKKPINIKLYDKFIYTDVYGNQQVIESKDSISQTFDKKEIKSEINLLLQMWYLEVDKFKQLKNLSARVQHYINHIYNLEKQIHNLGYVFDELNVVKRSDVKAFKKYKPFLSADDIGYVNKLYYEYADDFKVYVQLRDKFVQQAIILSLNFEKYEKLHTEFKFSQNDVNQMLDFLAENRSHLVPEPLIQMSKERSIYKPRFNRWLADRYQTFGIKDYETAIEEHWKYLENKLTKTQNSLLPITRVADSKIFLCDDVHILILNDLYSTFHRWFSTRNDHDFKLELSPIGTQDVKVPHMIVIDKDYAVRIANENRLDEEFRQRVVERDSEAYKELPYDEVQYLIESD